MADLDISILSPSKVVLNTAAKGFVYPSILGEIGLLPGHAPMVSEIGVGEMTVGPDKANRFFVSGGYVDVRGNKVVVMAEIIERPEDINVERAQKALERAQGRLEKPTEDLDLTRAMASLARATQRLSIAR